MSDPASHRAILFTNINTVWIGPVRTHCAALTLEYATYGGPSCELRGFGYSASWPVFDIVVPSIEYTLELAESTDAIAIRDDGTTRPLLRGGYLHIKGLEGAPTPIQFDLDDHERALDVTTFEGKDLYPKMWRTLEAKVVDYYNRPAIPVLSHVPYTRSMARGALRRLENE